MTVSLGIGKIKTAAAGRRSFRQRGLFSVMFVKHSPINTHPFIPMPVGDLS